MPTPANMSGKLLHCQSSPNARAFGRVKVTFLKGALPTLTRPLRSGAPLGVGTRGASRPHPLDLASGRSNTRLEGTAKELAETLVLASHVQLLSTN
jgi:hypothetical protein